MHYKTRGIVLHYIKYRETSIIVRVFTALFGCQSYLIQSVRTRKPKYNIGLFQPLTPLDMVVYHKKQASLQYVAELKYYQPMSHILSDVKKAAVATFLAELLTQVLHEEVQNESLFCFLLESVTTLNETTTDSTLFYLHFMLQLCHYLGFGMQNIREMEKQLLRLGLHTRLDPQELAWADTLLTHTYKEAVCPSTHGVRKLTDRIITFYQLHVDTFRGLKSLPILEAIHTS